MNRTFPPKIYRLQGVALERVCKVTREYGQIRMTILPGTDRAITLDMDDVTDAYISDLLRAALPVGGTSHV